MSFASFVQAHAAHADWRVALAQSQKQVQTQIAARAAQQGESAPFTLGWCYLSDYYAPAAEAILDELRLRLPGVAWVGTVGMGVAASGVEYIDEPALVLMVAPLPRESLRLFSGLQPLPAASSGFMVHTALVHAEGSTPDLHELLHELSSRLGFIPSVRVGKESRSRPSQPLSAGLSNSRKLFPRLPGVLTAA
jgi:small ligand-binding sensory domain FIST